MAMKNTLISLGMMAVPVAVESAATTEESLSTLCDHGGEGDPTPINKLTWCKACGEVPAEGHLVKGKKLGEGFALLSAEELEAIKEAPKPFGTRITLALHPAAEVEAATWPVGASYFLVPKSDTIEANYATLVALVKAMPTTAFVARFTLRTAESLYRLGVRGQVLFLQQLVWPDQVKAVPAGVEVTVKRAQLTQAKGLVAQLVEPFVAGTYTETARAQREQVLAGRQPVGVAAEAEAAPGEPLDVMDALRASVEQAKGSGKSAKAKGRRRLEAV